MCQPEGKPLLGGQGDARLRLRLGRRGVAQAEMERGSRGQGPRQAIRVGQLLGKGEHCAALLPRLLRVAQQPQHAGRLAVARNPDVLGL
jgi:hypothetical protein